METNEIAGIGHQLVGALKQTVGKLIGDAKLKSDGTTERVLGKARNGAGGQLVPGIDTDRITGFVHQSKGEAEQALGGLIGYAKLMTDGRAEQRVGKAENAAGSARDEARDAGKTGKPARTRRRPPTRSTTLPRRREG